MYLLQQDPFLTLIVLNYNLFFAQIGPVDSLLNASSLRLISIDSCGKQKNFPNETEYHLSFHNFQKKSIKKNKFDRYTKRKGYYNGIFNLKSDEQNPRSKYWSNVKGYYRIDGNKIILNWNDNFKVQEQFNQFDPDISYWFRVGMNAFGNIIINSKEINFEMKGTDYKKGLICIKFIMMR